MSIREILQKVFSQTPKEKDLQPFLELLTKKIEEDEKKIQSSFTTVSSLNTLLVDLISKVDKFNEKQSEILEEMQVKQDLQFFYYLCAVYQDLLRILVSIEKLTKLTKEEVLNVKASMREADPTHDKFGYATLNIPSLQVEFFNEPFFKKMGRSISKIVGYIPTELSEDFSMVSTLCEKYYFDFMNETSQDSSKCLSQIKKILKKIKPLIQNPFLLKNES